MVQNCGGSKADGTNSQEVNKKSKTSGFFLKNTKYFNTHKDEREGFKETKYI